MPMSIRVRPDSFGDDPRFAALVGHRFEVTAGIRHLDGHLKGYTIDETALVDEAAAAAFVTAQTGVQRVEFYWEDGPAPLGMCFSRLNVRLTREGVVMVAFLG